MAFSAVVAPMRTAPDTSSLSSAMIAPGMGANQSSVVFSAAKPISLPSDILKTASARPFSTAHALSTLPARASAVKRSHADFCSSAVSPEKRYTPWPAFLKSVVTISLASAGATAKEMSVGGTSWSRKVPDMESLPPMAAASR